MTPPTLEQPKDSLNPVLSKDSVSQEQPSDPLDKDDGIKNVAKYDIALTIEDIIVDWFGGGEKDADNNSFTYKQYANNYWDIHDLDTDVFTKVEIAFTKAVEYDNIDVIATYSDETKTTERISSGAKNFALTFEPGHMVATIGTPSKDGPAPTEGIIEVRNVNFSSAKTLKALVKGKGSITLRLDKRDGANVASVNSSASDWQELEAKCTGITSGVHTVYLIIKGDVQFDTWQFAN